MFSAQLRSTARPRYSRGPVRWHLWIFHFILLFHLLFSGLLLSGCQSIPPPRLEYTLARAAQESAQSVDAARHSPGFWGQGEEAYRQARVYFRDRYWDKAKDAFIKARLAYEKAENSARLIRQKTGEFL